MANSIKVNYILNLINTVTKILFPVIAFPYAARIMLADGIGLVNFHTSIVTYISLFTCLGIPLYAVREVAKVRDNIQERNKITLEIMILHLILTALGYVAVVLIAFLVPKVNSDIPVFFILSSTILFTAIGCEWFFQGVEDFLYITVRGIIVKIISLILLFVFLKTKEDILIYAVYTVIGSLGGNIFNFIKLNKIVNYKLILFSELKPFRHVIPTLRLFALNLVSSLYLNLNILMLGFFKTTNSVGLFVGANKLSLITMTLVTALSTVMISRFTNIVSNNQLDLFKSLITKILTFVVALTLPLAIGMFVVAPLLIPLFCGESYIPAIVTLRIMSIIIIMIGLSNTISMQILFPQGKELLVLKSAVLGAFVNLILNAVLIPKYDFNGAAISTAITEIVVTICLILISRRYIPIDLKRLPIRNYLLASLGMFLSTSFFMYFFNFSLLTKFSICVCIGVFSYASVLLLLRDSLLFNALAIVRKIKNKHF